MNWATLIDSLIEVCFVDIAENLLEVIEAANRFTVSWLMETRNCYILSAWFNKPHIYTYCGNTISSISTNKLKVHRIIPSKFSVNPSSKSCLLFEVFRNGMHALLHAGI